MKLMAQVVFSGNIEHDSDGLADALRDEGYEVHRMPELHPQLESRTLPAMRLGVFPLTGGRS
jgi:hypothetical protein